MATAITFLRCSILTALFIQAFVCVNCFSLIGHALAWRVQSDFAHLTVMIFVHDTHQYFPARLPAFGPRFNEVLRGQLVQASGDRFGCHNETDFQTSNVEGGEYEGKILLLQRGECSYITKVKRVQEAGGIAAILGPKSSSDRSSRITNDGACHAK